MSAPVSLEEAVEFWQEAFGTGVPYHSLSVPGIVRNVAHRGAEFAEVVRAFESAKPHPSNDVLAAVDARLTELAAT